MNSQQRQRGPGSGRSPYESQEERRYDVQTWRKVAYYGGAVLVAVGLILFFIPFVSFFSVFRSIGSGAVAGDAPLRPFSMMPLGFVGVPIVIAGQKLRSIGRRGLAGSGVVLSPEGEVRDAEPWQRSKGAQIQDTLEEVPLLRDAVARGGVTEPQIRVRCPSCGYLETEDASFCSGCGSSMFSGS